MFSKTLKMRVNPNLKGMSFPPEFYLKAIE